MRIMDRKKKLRKGKHCSLDLRWTSKIIIR